MVSKKFPTIILLLILISLTNQYTIDGRWKLQIDPSYKNISPNQTIIFEFTKQIINNTIVSQTVIFACSAIFLNFTVQNSIAGFSLRKIGMSRSQCVKDQVSEIISRLEKVAFTSTIGNILMFLSPSGKIIVRLSKVQNQKYNKNIVGAWQVTRLNNQDTTIVVKTNSTTLQFCQGNATVTYKIPSQNVIDFTIKSVKGCQQNDLLTALYRTKYYRLYGDDQLWFYNGNYQLLMRWNHIGNLSAQAPLSFLLSSMMQFDQPVSEKNSLSNQSSIVAAVSSKIVQVKPIEPKPTQQKIEPTSIKQPITTMTTTTSTSTKNPTQLEKQYPIQKNLKKQQLVKKWSLLGSPQIVLTMTPVSMVIKQCGMWITTYMLKQIVNGQAEIFGLMPKNSLVTCVGNGNIIQGFLNNLKFLTIGLNQKNEKILQFRNKDKKVIALWRESIQLR